MIHSLVVARKPSVDGCTRLTTSSKASLHSPLSRQKINLTKFVHSWSLASRGSMSGPGGQQPPYGCQPQPPRQPARQSDPYPVSGGPRAADSFFSNLNTQQQVFRQGALLSFDNSSIIDIRTHVDDNAALTGGRTERDRYWTRQLQYNLQNWRSNNIGMIQIDRDGRPWGVALRCEVSWHVLRQSDRAPRFSLIWDRDLGEFSLYCSQSEDGSFVLGGNSV